MGWRCGTGRLRNGQALRKVQVLRDRQVLWKVQVLRKVQVQARQSRGVAPGRCAQGSSSAGRITMSRSPRSSWVTVGSK